MVVMLPYSGLGLGDLIIQLSSHMALARGQPSGPETPLSSQAKHLYRRFQKRTILRYLQVRLQLVMIWLTR